MRFPNSERFYRYCVNKRRTYLRQLFEKRNPRGFFDLWKAQYDFAGGRIEVDELGPAARNDLRREIGWLLMQDLHQVVRGAAPDFPPAPPSLIRALPGALFQVRNAHSMLIAGPSGVGKEQLAILLHVLAGRSGALVRLAAPELAIEPRTPTRQLMPEKGSVFLGALEGIDATGQEELLAFLNGEARRRDLLFFVSTCCEPRSLVGEVGIRRDLFVRVSQTEVRIPALDAHADDRQRIVGDVVYDLVRIPAGRLPELRSEARSLAEEWRTEANPPLPAAYDLFAEALSYVMWREKKAIAHSLLAPVNEHIAQPASTAQTPSELREIAADGFDAVVRRLHTTTDAGSDRPAGGTSREPLARAAPPASRSLFPLPSGAAKGGESPSGDVAVPTHLSRDQLLRAYYHSLVLEERGDLRRVAARAGRRLHVLQAELSRLGVRVAAAATAGMRPEEN